MTVIRLWALMLITGLAPLVSADTLADMGQPIPLRQLVKAADAVAIARVVHVRRLTRSSDDGSPTDSVASFVVERLVYSRKERPTRFDVEYCSTMICPPPYSYSVGDRCFVMLKRAGNRWSPIFFRDAAYHTVQELEYISSRVQAYLKVLAIVDTHEREAGEIDWLVDNVNHSTTRSDALDEIAPEYILINEPGDLAPRLSAGQLDRLVKFIPGIQGGAVPGWHIGQLALLMKFRHHSRALPSILGWLRNCPLSMSITTFAWAAGACSSLAGKPDSQLPFMEKLLRTRTLGASSSERDGFFTLVKRRAIMSDFVDSLSH